MQINLSAALWLLADLNIKVMGGIRIVYRLSAKLDDHVFLSVATHDRNGQCCPAQVQERTFETKITLAISVVCKRIEEPGRQRLKTKAVFFPRNFDIYLAGSRTPESYNFNSHRSERLNCFPRTGFLNLFNYPV